MIFNVFRGAVDCKSLGQVTTSVQGVMNPLPPTLLAQLIAVRFAHQLIWSMMSKNTWSTHDHSNYIIKNQGDAGPGGPGGRARTATSTRSNKKIVRATMQLQVPPARIREQQRGQHVCGTRQTRQHLGASK